VNTATKDTSHIIGRSPDRLTLEEQFRLAGKCIALEIYSPETLPFRLIEAIGDSIADCVRALVAKGRDPKQFEYRLLPLPY
jgi:hypothetical protein